MLKFYGPNSTLGTKAPSDWNATKAFWEKRISHQ